MKVYVGNLSAHTTPAHLKAAFESFGAVVEVTILEDASTSLSRGFGFVSMSSSPEAQAAICALHGSIMEGRTLTVAEAFLPGTRRQTPAHLHA